MSNTTYNRDKVKNFKLAFQEYQNAKLTFKEEMQQFQAVMDFMSGDNDYNNPDVSVDSNGYVINENGIMMKVSGSSETTYDSSVNNVIDIGSKKAFFTDVQYQGDTNAIGETNKLYQVGLDDLKYDSAVENIISSDHKYVTTTKQPEISSVTDCNLNHLTQCSARAKMKNKPYYGLIGGTDVEDKSICNCYIFDEQPTNNVSERIKTIKVNTGNDSDKTSYLATLMDGNFYKIKESNYSNNYTGFYKYDSMQQNTLYKLIDGNSTENDVGLNPFVGNGINSINITGLGESYCITK